MKQKEDVINCWDGTEKGVYHSVKHAKIAAGEAQIANANSNINRNGLSNNINFVYTTILDG